MAQRVNRKRQGMVGTVVDAEFLKSQRQIYEFSFISIHKFKGEHKLFKVVMSREQIVELVYRM